MVMNFIHLKVDSRHQDMIVRNLEVESRHLELDYIHMRCILNT